MRNVAKIVLTNLVIFGFLVFFLNTMSIAAIHAFNWGKAKQYDESHLLPNYVGAGWAIDHFTEYYELVQNYEAYYGWKREPFAGATINIDADGRRATHVPPDASPTRSVAFFGGSTTWGTGAYDDATIPSEFVKLNPGYRGYNFGETGYVAHQSLNRFLESYFQGMRPELVIFYDGVNDVWHKCRSELDSYAHAREFHIRKILEEGTSQNPESLWFTVQPIRNFATKVSRILGRRANQERDYYDCHKNPAKAEQVARVLLSDWTIVKTIVESLRRDIRRRAAAGHLLQRNQDRTSGTERESPLAVRDRLSAHSRHDRTRLPRAHHQFPRSPRRSRRRHVFLHRLVPPVAEWQRSGSGAPERRGARARPRR